MFERRLKIFLMLLLAGTVVLMLRAAQLQIVRRSEWTEQAADALKRTQLIETTRGALRDRRGNAIAIDLACIDACVDYRALTDPPDPVWVKSIATQWAKQRRAQEWRSRDAAGRRRLIDDEKAHVLQSVHAMFGKLAELGERSPEDIDEIRRDTIRRVEVARRYTWYRNYKRASDAHTESVKAESGAWWKGWLTDDAQDAPRLDDFDVRVAEQTEAHPILRAVSTDVQNTLGKHLDDYPGLSLRPGMTRSYPYNDVGCHVVGQLTRVRREDIEADPAAKDELRRFQYSDLVGRTGLEALCEPLLRGSRGRIEKFFADAESSSRSEKTHPAEPGRDVRATIDMDLQQQILSLFRNAQVELKGKNPDGSGEAVVRKVSVHGGAVLIDVASSEVLALVSNPTFDPNTLDAELPELMKDTLNRVLMNRATQYPLETGSTIKPVVGLGAITQGVLGVNDGIECTGYLTINGKRSGFGRCWIVTKYGTVLGSNVAHHPIPDAAPHRGHDGNADGFLTFADALERSCNIYFETLAHRLGLDGLSYWMDKFGLGRPTGVGIEEARGKLPNSYDGPNVAYATYVSGIGQSPVSATTIQMANVAATIARDGVWARPTLLQSEDTQALRAILQRRAATSSQPATQPATLPNSPAESQPWWRMSERVDLKLSPAALSAAQEGMYKVVNSRGGTGLGLAERDGSKPRVAIAGKTGTAEAGPLKLPVTDANGNVVKDENGRKKMEFVTPSTVDRENPEAPWYLGFDADGKNLKHSWIIGFAPAKNPQVAFAVMVEYGGSGGNTAAAIARGMLDAAIEHGYLAPDDWRSEFRISKSETDAAR